jgi:hypothetical protein
MVGSVKSRQRGRLFLPFQEVHGCRSAAEKKPHLPLKHKPAEKKEGRLIGKLEIIDEKKQGTEIQGFWHEVEKGIEEALPLSCPLFFMRYFLWTYQLGEDPGQMGGLLRTESLKDSHPLVLSLIEKGHENLGH